MKKKVAHANESFANMVGKASMEKTLPYIEKVLDEAIYPIFQRNNEMMQASFSQMAHAHKVLQSIVLLKLNISVEEYAKLEDEVEDTLAGVTLTTNDESIETLDYVRFYLITTDPEGVVSGPVLDRIQIPADLENDITYTNLIGMKVGETKEILEQGYKLELKIKTISRKI